MILIFFYAENLTASSERIPEENRPELSKLHKRGIISAFLVLLIVNLLDLLI